MTWWQVVGRTPLDTTFATISFALTRCLIRFAVVEATGGMKDSVRKGKRSYVVTKGRPIVDRPLATTLTTTILAIWRCMVRFEVAEGSRGRTGAGNEGKQSDVVVRSRTTYPSPPTLRAPPPSHLRESC